MNKIIVSNYGSGLAIGLEGSQEFQEQQFNRFFNFGGASKYSELHKETDTFSYFLSNAEDMIKALAANNFVRYLTNGQSKLFKGLPKEMEQATITEAENEFNSYECENFMSYRAAASNSVNGIAQNGRAETWEEDFKPAR